MSEPVFRRRVVNEPRAEPEAEARLLRRSRMVWRIEVQRALDMARISRSRHFRLRGCASMTEYGRRLGLRPCETRDRVKAGLLFLRRPDLAEEVARGRIPISSAGHLLDVVDDPEEGGETWIERARTDSAPDFAQQVEERLAARRMGSPPVRLSIVASREAKQRFDEARCIVERKRQRACTEGEALEAISSDYVARHDPRPRPLASDPPPEDIVVSEIRGRTIPAAVRRAVRARDRDRCRVPGCRWRGRLHFSHVIPYRHGGPPTVRNLLLLCPLHNQMMEHGLLRIVGDAHDARFLDARGQPYVVRWAEARSDPQDEDP